MTLRLLALLLIAGCSSPIGHTALLTLDPDTAWTMHTIHNGVNGADGSDLKDVNGDGLIDVTTPWEEAGLVTVSLHPTGDPRGVWDTVTVGSNVSGVEAAIFADVDGDGNIDVVSAAESNAKRVTIHFAPSLANYLVASAWTSVTITSSTSLRWMALAFADVDGDGRKDIIAGGKTDPANIVWFKNPTTPRTGSAWVKNVIGPCHWAMNLVARDMDADGDIDVVVSDRDYITTGGVHNYTLQGSRWLEQTTTGWVNHGIGTADGNHKMFTMVDYDADGNIDVLDGRSSATLNTTYLKLGTAWATTQLPPPGRTGQYQAAAVGDIDGNGTLDLVYSYSEALGVLSGVVGQLSDGSRIEISGAPGTKYDNLDLVDIDGDGDLDVVTTEQVDQLGLIWYENPSASMVPPPPDAGLDAAWNCPCP